MILRFTLFLTLVFVTHQSFAGDIQAAFQSLQNVGENWEPDGAVCEQLARLKIRAAYPENQYTITGDIEYDTGALTIGELDVIVIEKSSNRVILVQEVKCWKNFAGGLEKAQSQKLRFLWHLGKTPQAMRFTSYDGTKLTAANFASSFPFVFVSQAGGVAKGFDEELDLNLSEIKQLRMQLLKCQDQGHCKKPDQE
ncbi:hypothetical protein [Bdellovibrio sp. NC01]|uniref:hypothetical protein n=1 Tax=Bdellovibrio sp. NC01 TaxID=2220073 RepID=UPI001158F6B3|nr:hypothetical protein [Bdellovibrio sp. NC01]